MNAKEIERLHWMRLLAEGRTTQRKAAEALGLTARHVRRLYEAYSACGAPGLTSRRRGARSNRTAPDEVRVKALSVVRALYADFGPTLAQEKLAELHGLKLSVETLRKWMVADGLWSTRRERRKRVQQPRHRRACVGELIQIDGCLHDWFEDRGARCTLLVYVDDASGRLMELRFARSESTFEYFEATRSYLKRHGKPHAFYSDKAAIFRVNAKNPKAGDGFTQFGRAMHDLNIDVICANTPGAKGRVERAHQVLQDRLVKELRLRAISTMADANAYVPEFIEDYNRRFGRSAASSHDAHRPLLEHETLDRVFTWQEERCVTQNLTLHYKRVMYLLEPSDRARATAGKYVLVRETEDGEVVIEHKGIALPARAFEKDARVRQGAIVDNKVLAAALTDIQRQQQARDAHTLASKRMTLREEDLFRESLGEGLPAERTRRGTRPTIRQQALAKLATGRTTVSSSSSPTVDRILAQALQRLGTPGVGDAPHA